jgi:hypothetical protein
MIGLPLTAVAACAAAPEPGAEIRVLVQLARPQADAGAIAAQASRSSGHVARYVAASGGNWHALAIACAGPDDCDIALQRLASDGIHFAAAQRDARKHVVSP